MRKLKLFSLFLCLFIGIGQMWATDPVTLAAWTFSSTSYPANRTNFAATSGTCTGSTFYLDGTGSTWNTVAGKGYAFTAVTSVTITLKLSEALPAGTQITFAADIFYNNAKNAPMKGFDMSVSVNEGSFGTTGLTPTSISLTNSSANKSITYTTQSALAKNATIALKYTQTGKAGAGQGFFNNITIVYTPSGSTQPTVSARPNDESYGSVFVSGTTITANPNEGYRVMSGADGYSVIVGDPTSVTNNGDNTFTVSTTADCTIKINFEAIPQYTVTWNNNGDESVTTQVYEGEKPAFPATPASCDATSTTFIGWATAHWDGKIANLNEKTVYTSAAEMPAVTGPVEYFAVFAKVAGESGWIETAIGDLGASDVFVIVGNNGSTYAMTNDKGANSAPVASAVTIANSKITSDVADNIKWNISGNATDGYTFYPNGDSESWLYCTNTNNGVRVGTNTNKTFAISGGYLKHSGTSRYVGIYDSQDWRCYTGTDGNIKNQTFKFYKYSAGSASNYMTTCAAAGTCEAPSFSPEAGTFDEARDITLKTSTPSAHIYYTLDGTDPDNGSAEYSTPIHITQNTTIKAITYADGLTESSISTGVFNIRYAQPTFSLEEGEYTTAQNVTISAAGADAVYYTINGDDPIVDPANLYDGSAIAINTTGSHTIKAIAVKAGYANSNVASATYVMDLPYGSIAEFVTAKPNTAKDLVFEEADNCVITGINGNSVYVQDASGKGMIIFNKSGYGALEFHVGDRIVGTVNGKYQAFNGQHEMSLAVFAEGVTFTAVSRPTPVPVTAIDETAFNANTQILVKIEDLYYKSSSDKTHKFATAGGSTEYTIYDQFGIMSGKTMPETSVACNLTGILSVFNTTYQLLPVFATDIVADADAAAPVFTPAGGATEGEAVQVDLNSYVSIAPADANHSVDITSAQITTTEPVSVTAVSTRDFYRNTSVTKWYYGNSASASYEINGQGSTAQGTIVAKVNDEIAASAKENDEVHVFITPEEHFALNTITVNGNVPATESAGTEYSFTMPGEAVTIAVTWTEDAKATLTFAKGDANGEEAAPENIVDYIGETIQMPANPFTYTGHKFAGWSCDGGTTKLAAGVNYVLAEDKAFVAQWDEIPTFNNSGYEWQLVTSAAQLVAGKYYVIASTAKGKVMSNTISSNVAGEIAATFTDGVIAYNAFGSSQSADVAGVAVLQLGGEEGAWKLTEVVANDALLGATAVKKIAWGSGTTTWSISFANNNATIQNGTSAYGRFLHNVQNTRFTTYTSDPAADMLLPQLYVWAEKVYKLRYDANGGENAPAAQAADGEGKATVTDVKPTYTDHIFNGWNTLVGGNGEAKAAGDVIDLSAGDVTLYAQWRTPATVTISYDANGGEGTMVAVENQTEGSTYTIKTNTFERNGYLFVGWKAYDANDVELTITNGKFIVPATNVTLKAQWHSATDSKWVLVEYLSQLADGDKVIIAAAGYDYALSTQTNNNRGAVEISKSGKLLIPNAAVQQLTLGKNGSNYTFHTDAGYLYAASSTFNYLRTQETNDDNGKWTITLAEGGVATITAQGSNTRNVMSYNTSHLFACYASDNTQKDIVIYKYLDIDPEDATSGYEREDLVLSGIGTICLPYDVKASDRFGGVFYMPSHKTSGFANFVEETGTLRAGKAYIFVAENEFIRLKYSGDEVSEPLSDPAVTRGLIGTFTGYGYGYTGNLEHKYVVANNKLMECGSGAWVNPYRAYLDLEVMPEEALVINDGPGAAPRRRLGIGGNAPTVPTGFENVQGDNGQCTKVLINGELFILRGEKMYDAKGQLVK